MEWEPVLAALGRLRQTWAMAESSSPESPDPGGAHSDSGRFERKIPPGDDRQRLVCTDCGFIHYENPKVVVGAVATWDDRILLCRRAIHPRKGYWTLPAGFLELHESAADGAKREAWEEARAELEIEQLLAVYSIPRISQIQLIYRARLVSPDVAAGAETEELDLFRWEDIPWEEIAFPSVHWALGHFAEVRGQSAFAPRFNPPDADAALPPEADAALPPEADAALPP